jgi:hypothetical protein
LSLHFNVPSLHAAEVPGSPITAGCETIDAISTPSPLENSAMAPSEQGTTIHTTFSFNLTIPVQDNAQSGHVMHLDKTVTSNGVSITLERIAITPNGTLIYVKDGNIITNQVVTVNGKEVIPDGEVETMSGESTESFANASHSKWTLTYTSNPDMQETDKFGRLVVGGMKGIRGGPWVFTFTTP